MRRGAECAASVGVAEEMSCEREEDTEALEGDMVAGVGDLV